VSHDSLTGHAVRSPVALSFPPPGREQVSECRVRSNPESRWGVSCAPVTGNTFPEEAQTPIRQILADALGLRLAGEARSTDRMYQALVGNDVDGQIGVLTLVFEGRQTEHRLSPDWVQP